MMDRLLEQYRRYYWAANGLLVLAIAYTLAGIGVRFAVDLVPLPAPKPRVVAVQRDERPASFTDYQVILSRNLLNAKVEEAPPPPPDAANAEPAKSTIQATLMGTVAGARKYAFAIVQAQAKTEVVRIGEKIAGQAEVLEIERGRITIMNNGRKEELTMYEDKELARNTPAALPALDGAAPPPPPVPGQENVEVRPQGENRYEIDKGQFEQMTSNLGPLLTQARVVPHFENGVIDGYKIFAIKPDSLYQKIGLENGDVIQNINGIQVDSPEKALQMFQSLRTERTFTINLSRNNERQTFYYNLR
jgi:general secretion pathway protein C